MALATQCPHCRTTFKVAHDQLKLRAGLVRCGACKQIFNGIENLLPAEAGVSLPRPSVETRTVAPQAPSVPVSSSTFSSSSVSEDVQPYASASRTQEEAAPVSENEKAPPAPPSETAQTEAITPEPGSEEAPFDRPEESGAGDEPEEANEADRSTSGQTETVPDPLQRMTLLDLSEHNEEGLQAAAAPLSQPDPLDAVMAELERKPLRGAARRPQAEADAETDEVGEEEDDATDEPTFLQQGRRRQRRAHILRRLMIAGSVLLLIVLLAQAAYVWRDQLAARLPQTKPLLLEACAYLDCQVGLPSRIEAISLESSELQTLAAGSNTLVLTLLLRNHDVVAQTWPHLELSLNDNSENSVLRRVFTPADYLPKTINPRLGFPAQSEQAVRLYFELTGVKPSGYRVYLFHP
ncbi:MAG TPA: DUF3426 domain-containing protein [Noviherbaspirillum sp.]